MSIILTCSCGAQSVADSQFAGQVVVCPTCGAHMQVPFPSSPSPVFQTAGKFRPPPGTVQPKSQIKYVPIIVAGVALLVILITAMFVMPMIMKGRGDEYINEVSSHPIMIEKIGTVTNYRWNMFASLGAGRKHHIFDIEGTKGNGQLDCREHVLSQNEIMLITSEGKWVLKE